MARSNLERVLIVHPFGIGDALFVTPVIRALCENGAQKIDLILGSRTRELFETHPAVDQIFVADRDRLRSQSIFQSIREIAALLGKLRKNRYGLLLDFSLSRQYAFFAFLFFGIPKRVGFSYKNRGIFLTDRIELPGGFSGKHAVDYYLDLLGQIPLAVSSRNLELYLNASDESEARSVFESLHFHPSRPFLAVAPGGGESWGKDARLKRWPADYFFKLIEKTRAEFGTRLFEFVVVLGGKNEWELGESLRLKDPVRIFNLCGKTSLRTSAAILKSARFLVANDGGLVHMASAVGTPVLALFGPVDPKVYGPYPPALNRAAITNDGPECRPCYQNMRYNRDCQHIDCLNTLYPETVFRIARERGFFECFFKEELSGSRQ